MEQLLMPTLAVRLDHAAALVDDESRSRRVAEILMRPCFRELERVSAYRRDRWFGHRGLSVDAIIEILRERKNRSASFDTKRGRELGASGEIENGTHATGSGAVRFASHLVLPLVASDVETIVTSICELADALAAGSGYVTVEPDYGLAQDAALGSSVARPRVGLSDLRRRARRRRGWPLAERDTSLTGPEWGTFLGAGHLARIDLDVIRVSGAFERVVSISASLVFLQVTADPADELREDFDAKLQRARDVLAPILMDVSEVSLA